MIRLLVNRKQLIILVAMITAVALLFCALYLTRPKVEQEDTTDLEGTESEEVHPIALIADMLAQIDRQAEIDEMLLAELNSGAYSFDDPLVVVDPYGMSPLTALVLFTSDEPLNVSVHVQGKTELADVDFTFDGYNTSHQIPVYGLYPGELNTVWLSAVTPPGVMREIVLEIQTDPLPLWLEKNIIITDLELPDNYQPGFNFTFVQKTAFDVNGEYRWFYESTAVLQGTTIYGYNGGNIILSLGSTHEGDSLIYEINEFGKILRVLYSPYGIHHDITTTEGGNLIVTGSYGETREDLIYEIDIDSGRIINTLDLKRLLQRTRTSNSPEYSTTDWFHNNSIIYYNGEIIISGRYQSAIVKLTWPEGQLEWILSNHAGWNQMFQKYLLTPIGNGFEWSYCQHSIELLPDLDNNPDTIDIMLFDNGNTRFTYERELMRAAAANEVIKPENYSRTVHYRINEKENTVEQIWQFGKELGENYHSSWRGDANLLDNGNILGVFDRNISQYGGDFNTNFIEVARSGSIIWEAYATSTDSIGTYSAYRCERLQLYNFAANNLQIGVPVINLIPEVMLS